jgi:nucleotide-binding universal stress UspA family protein
MHTDRPILIAYDGSDDARHAIDEAAAIHPGARAIVLYAREPLESAAAHLEGHPALEDVRGIDADLRDAAERLAADGADYARRPALVIPSPPLAEARRTFTPAAQPTGAR